MISIKVGTLISMWIAQKIIYDNPFAKKGIKGKFWNPEIAVKSYGSMSLRKFRL